MQAVYNPFLFFFEFVEFLLFFSPGVREEKQLYPSSIIDELMAMAGIPNANAQECDYF